MKHLLAVLTLWIWPVMAQNPGAAGEPAQGPQLYDTLGAAELLTLKLPAVIPSPLDFGQTARQKLPVFSLEGISWTASRFAVEGLTATDPIQPGRPVVLPDPGGVSDIQLGGYAPTLFYSFRQATPSWHGSGSMFLTGGSLYSSNLPAPDERALIQTSSRFHRFTNANVETGGKAPRGLGVLFSGRGGGDP